MASCRLQFARKTDMQVNSCSRLCAGGHRSISRAVSVRAQQGYKESSENNSSSHVSSQRKIPGAGSLAGAAVGLAAAAAVMLTGPAAVHAADAAKVGSCVLQNCQVALAKCVGDVECLENLVCLNLCNGAEDETACQIRCGDLYADEAVEAFNACAVSDKKCVPQRVDKGMFPVPPDCALDVSFNPSEFQGRWYITAGLNPLFDIFDCQEHFFASPEPGKLYGKLNWRINKPDSDFIERSTMQRFVQDTSNPAILYNHDNEFLHYEDDWYVLAYEPDEYVFVYYLGNNDAWKGYGGATVYTRANSLPEKYIPELSAAAERAGLAWSDFQLTDNSCRPHPPPRPLVQQLEQNVEEVGRYAASNVRAIEYKLEEDLMSFGKGFTMLGSELETGVLSKISKGEEVLAKEVNEAGRLIRRFEMEAKMGPWVNWLPLSVREIIMPVK